MDEPAQQTSEAPASTEAAPVRTRRPRGPNRKPLKPKLPRSAKARAALEAQQTGVEAQPGLGVDAMSFPRDAVEQKLEHHYERVPMSSGRRKMEVPNIPGYHLHWINDYPGRVQQALAAGYTMVKADETRIHARTGGGGNDDLGSGVSMVVGQQEGGQALKAYLMKIPQDLYDSDQKAAQQSSDRVEAALRSRKGMAAEGESGRDHDNRYVKTSDFSFNRTVPS